MVRKSRSTGNPPGRPPKYSSPEEMELVIDDYFAECDKGKSIKYWDPKRKKEITISQSIPYTMERLSIFLGFSGVKSLWEYKKKAKFSEVLTRARTLIAAECVEGTMIGRYPPQFVPFRLCNMDKDNYQSINQGHISIDVNLNQAQQLTKGINRVANIPKQIAERKGIKLLTPGKQAADKLK